MLGSRYARRPMICTRTNHKRLSSRSPPPSSPPPLPPSTSTILLLPPVPFLSPASNYTGSMAKSRLDSSDFNDAEWLAGLGIDSVVDCKDEQERWYVCVHTIRFTWCITVGCGVCRFRVPLVVRCGKMWKRKLETPSRTRTTLQH